jgi:hypothetical protein
MAPEVLATAAVLLDGIAVVAEHLEGVGVAHLDDAAHRRLAFTNAVASIGCPVIVDVVNDQEGVLVQTAASTLGAVMQNDVAAEPMVLLGRLRHLVLSV